MRRTTSTEHISASAAGIRLPFKRRCRWANEHKGRSIGVAASASSHICHSPSWLGTLRHYGRVEAAMRIFNIF
ncbi:hypothetical protein PYCCODRAFT_1193104 [Trametes coccinea BRFM310]|uniref:Uncharacterized protein n=1 Tax=Trametes coccinea (strain BRFM310) TaxID=1353009 RepID=A0A1Y2IB93_TRAC3|nr:hypothetical protein PYCCODRAFT_1193104 [Trametes coccinea BRFM310]